MRRVDPLQHFTQISYDDAGRVAQTTACDREGHQLATSETTYDSAGRPVREIDHRFDHGRPLELLETTFLYDAEDRLTQVRQENDDIVAHYTYDAQNRRIERTVAGRTFRTLWDGWRPIEEVEVIEGQDILLSRRVYGPGFDDIVRLEQRVGGQLETYFPVYDSLGNLAALTDDQGDLIERYLYTPYGARTVWVDDTPPVVEQVRFEDGTFVLELSEAIQFEPFLAALGAGTVTLTNTTDATDIALAATQPITTGRLAGRRLVLTPTDPVDEGDILSLAVPGSALHDLFGNPATAGITETTTYASTGTTVLRDTTPPRIEEIGLTADQRLKVTVSEPVDPSSTSTALPIDSTSASWTVDDTGAVFTSTPLPDGDHTLDITTAPLDLVGLGVAQASTHTATASASGPPQSIFTAPTPGLATSSTVGVDLGMDGLPIDLETGLYYVRNRYYDPELASFVTTDPLEYVDGPSVYAFAFNSPVNFGDPLGLTGGSKEEREAALALARDPSVQWHVRRQQELFQMFWGEFRRQNTRTLFAGLKLLNNSLADIGFRASGKNPAFHDPGFLYQHPDSERQAREMALFGIGTTLWGMRGAVGKPAVNLGSRRINLISDRSQGWARGPFIAEATPDPVLVVGQPLPDGLEIVVMGTANKPGSFILQPKDMKSIGSITQPGKSASIAIDLQPGTEIQPEQR